jgi:hypothetical protein
MTTHAPGERDARGDQGYVSSLVPRPHPLTPPGSPPSRWGELKASLAWIARSWLRPGDADTAWEQRAGREDRTP